jgi:hypothetical protein
LRDSRSSRDLVKLKAGAISKSGRINPLASTKHSLKITKQREKQRKHSLRCSKQTEKQNSKVEGIAATEIQRRKEEGECLRCAWPSDRKGTHRVKDCIKEIQLDPGTGSHARALRIG